jgi:uncharacterized protein (DUF2336 family)
MAATRSEALLARLEDTITRCSSSRRADVLRQVLALFVSPQSQGKCDLAALDEVLLRLSRPAETLELAELSGTVSRSGLALPKLAQRLAMSKAAAVAAPILTNSAAVPERLLREIAATRGQEHMLAMSGRSRISGEVAAALVMRGNAAVHRNLSRNHGARFSERTLSVLLKLAENDEELAEALASRADLSPALVHKFLSLATGAPRARFVAASSDETRSLGAGLTGPQTGESIVPELNYAEAVDELRGLSRTGKSTDAAVGRFALQGEHEKVVAALALLAETGIRKAEDLFFGERGELLAVACKAARLRWATAASILRSRPRVVSQDELVAAEAVFERISLSEAQRSIRSPGADRDVATARYSRR